MDDKTVSVFSSCAAKILRAQKHFTDLRNRTDAFLAEHPYWLEHVRGEQANEFRVVARDVKAPDAEIGIVAGEMAHQLRSALDYAIGELIEANTGRAPQAGHHFQFPIFETHTKRNADRFDYQVRGVSDAAMAILRNLQPYRLPEPKRSTLWLLHNIDIEDKHRALNVISGSAGLRSLKHTGKGGAAAMSFAERWARDPDVFPLEDGAVVFEYTSSDTDAHMEIDFSFYLAFENPPDAWRVHVSDFFARAVSHVTQVIGSLTATTERDDGRLATAGHSK